MRGVQASRTANKAGKWACGAMPCSGLLRPQQGAGITRPHALAGCRTAAAACRNGTAAAAAAAAAVDDAHGKLDAPSRKALQQAPLHIRQQLLSPRPLQNALQARPRSRRRVPKLLQVLLHLCRARQAQPAGLQLRHGGCLARPSGQHIPQQTGALRTLCLIRLSGHQPRCQGRAAAALLYLPPACGEVEKGQAAGR